MKSQMKKFLGAGCVLLLALTSTGCDSTIKELVIDQLVGFASSITSAALTSLVQSAFGTTTSAS
jgi:hypothetical protein